MNREAAALKAISGAKSVDALKQFKMKYDSLILPSAKVRVRAGRAELYPLGFVHKV